MATIITQRPAPWWGTAAGTLITGLLGNWLERSAQNEQNRKANAFQGQLVQDLQALTGGQQDSGLLSAQNVPEGYNANPWANTFHQSGSPVEQFNLGTSELTPQAPAQQQRLPTMNEILQASARLAATPRFSMMDPQAVQNMLAPYIQAAENQRMQALRSQYAQDFGNATNLDGQMGALIRGNIEGAVPADALNAYSPYAQHRQPHYQFGTVDAGNQILTTAMNPLTGQVSRGLTTPVGLSPNTQLSADTQRYITDVNAGTQRYTVDRDYGIRDRQVRVAEENAEYERNNPRLESVQGNDGTLYMMNPRTGHVEEVRMPNGQALKIDKKRNVVLTVNDNHEYVLIDQDTGHAFTPTYGDGRPVTADQAELRVRVINAKRKAINDQMKALQEKPVWEISDEQYAQNQAELDRLQGELNKLDQEERELLGGSTQAKPQNKPQAHTEQHIVPAPAPAPAPQTASPHIPATVAETVSRLVRRGAASRSVSPSRPSTRPSILGVSGWNSFIPQTSQPPASQDVPPSQPPATAQPPATQPQARQSTSQARMRDFDIPDGMIYSPERDKNIDRRFIYSKEHFRGYISTLLSDPKYAGYSTQQLINAAFRNGIRIKE